MPIRKIVRWVVVAGVLAAGSGCSNQPDITAGRWFRPKEPVQVSFVAADGSDRAESARPVGAPLALDINNQRGSVWVEVDPDLEAPVLEAIASWEPEQTRADWPGELGPARVSAIESVESAAGWVLRVDGELLGDPPYDSRVDLRLRVPRCDGINVENDGGPIVMVGVSGMITAVNGANNGRGGRIELRTDEPLVDPVALVTTQGRVSAVIAPESRGIIELDSEGGDAEFESEWGTFTEVRPGIRRYRAVWNGGSNPIIARSGGGDVHVQVQEAPERWSVADDWLALIGR